MEVNKIVKLLEKEISSKLPIYKAKRIDSTWDEWVVGYIARLDAKKRDDGLKFRYQFNAINEYVQTFECFVSLESVCRYTGKTDNEGNIIWEHDIVRKFADSDESGNDLYFYYEVVWNEKYARFEGHEIYSGETIMLVDLEDVVVVGTQIK